MLNVDQITSTLARLGDQQLQQYAALHKSDPYIMALALGESNRRKQLRAGAQRPPNQQPKVVDQELAAMAAPSVPTGLPEDMGIGKLPAQNMQRMAGGGIVAFGEGGDVPRYNGTGSSFVGPVMSFQQFLVSKGLSPTSFVYMTGPEQDALRDAYKAAGMGPPTGAQPTTAAATAAPTSAARAPTSMEKGITAVGNAMSGAGNYLKRGLGAISKYSPAAMIGEGLFFTSPEEMATLKKADAARLGKAAGATLKELGVPEGSSSAPMSSADVDAIISGTPAVTAPAAPGADGSGTTPSTPPAAPTTEQRLAELQTQLKTLTGGAKPAGGLPDLSAASLLRDREKLVRAPAIPAVLEAANTAYADAARQEKQAQLDEFEAWRKERGPAFQDREARLKASEARLKGREEQLAPMSLLEAGLAIMGGTSPRALQNLGAGAQVGLKSYNAGLEKLEAARDKLDEAFGKIEEYRRNEDTMDEKERRRLKGEIGQIGVEAKKFGRDALIDDWKLSQTTADKLAGELFKGKLEVYAQQQQNARAQQSAGIEMLKMAQPPAELRYVQGLTREDEAKLARIAAAKQDPRSVAGLVAAYAKNPMALKLLEQSDPALAAQIKREMQNMVMPTPVNVENALP